jgi:hypothetical protein
VRDDYGQDHFQRDVKACAADAQYASAILVPLMISMWIFGQLVFTWLQLVQGVNVSFYC